MKKNLILAGVLAGLLLLTYFVQEKKAVSDYNESLTKDHLITSGIKRLKIPNVTAMKKGDVWFDGDRRLSYNAFKVIEKKITEIKKIKDITGEKKTYFTQPLVIEVNDEIWTLGDLSFDRQGFYLARGEKIMLVMIDGESTELTQDEAEIAPKKYEELKFQLNKSYDELIEKQLFRFYPDLPMKRVLVEAFERLPYELNFEKNETLPAPIAGVSVHTGIQKKFHSLMTQMMIREELTYSESLKKKKMGTLKFMDGKEVTLELWLRDETSADAVLIDSQSKKAWLMIGGTLKGFFTLVQDYWDKKIIPQAEFKTFDRLPVILSQGNKTAEFEILNREPLKFESTKHKLNEANILSMVQIVFNLNQFDQADRVSILSKSEKKMLENLSETHVLIMGQELILWVKTEELIVVNVTQGFKAHFSMFHEKMGMRFEDMIK